MNTLDTNEDFIKVKGEDKLYADFVLNLSLIHIQMCIRDSDYTKEWDYSKSCSDIPSGMNYYTMTTETYKDWAIDNINGCLLYTSQSRQSRHSAPCNEQEKTCRNGVGA